MTSRKELRDGALLLKLIAQGEADARAGRLAPQDKVFKRPEGSAGEKVSRQRRPVLWTDVAREDLRGIVEYLAERNPDAARRVLAGIEQKAAVLLLRTA